MAGISIAARAGESGAVVIEAQGAQASFTCPDQALLPTADGAGSAFLLPSLAANAPLVSDDGFTPTWLAGARRLVETFSSWWGYARLLPRPGGGPESGAPAERTGLCFTCGVDSFYTLLRSRHHVDDLLFALGYDIALEDSERCADAERSVRAIADATGKTAVVVRSTLRRHPLVRAANWEHGHGGALTAIGHMLQERIGRLLISASYPRSHDAPWGTHWDTDHLWSSSRLSVEHTGEELWRRQRLWSIADEPLVRQHLRVCWEHRSLAPNCSRCEKCLRTMLELAGIGKLEEFTAFDRSESLEQRLDELDPIAPQILIVWQRLLQLDLERPVRRALRRLLRRSGHRPPGRLRR